MQFTSVYVRKCFCFLNLVIFSLGTYLHVNAEALHYYLEVNQRWSTGRSNKDEKLFSQNYYEEHVASSVITWGTLLLHSNLFVLFFQGPLRFKRTGAACLSAAACQHDSLSSRAEKGVQSMSRLTGMSLTLSTWRRREGSYACKKTSITPKKEIHVESQSSFRKQSWWLLGLRTGQALWCCHHSECLPAL